MMPARYGLTSAPRNADEVPRVRGLSRPPLLRSDADQAPVPLLRPRPRLLLPARRLAAEAGAGS